MKKKMLFILPLATLCVVGVGASTYQVLAEGEEEPIVEEVPQEEDKESVVDWEAIQKALDEAQAKLNKAMEYEFLGTTLGALIGSAITILMSFVFKKIGYKNIENACEVAKTSQEKVQEVNSTAKEQLGQLEKLSLELKEQKDLNADLLNANEKLLEVIKELKTKNELVEQDLNTLKEIILKMAYSNKELVKSGVASDLHENHDK